MGGSRLAGRGSGGSGTVARIVGHLSVAELEARYRAARDVTEARHAQAIWLLAQGRTVLEVAEVLAFAPRWVTQLAARYNACGPAALGDGRRRNGKAASLLTPDLLAALAERVTAPPERPVEVWAGDEHRLGLKPVRRRVWAPVGQRPIALGHHRYRWLHVVAFVQPTSGEAAWYLATGLSKPFFAALLAAFARQVGAGRGGHNIPRLDHPGRPSAGGPPRARGDQPGVPAALQSGAAARRAPLAAGRRACRQSALRHARRSRGRRRRALPPARGRRHQATHRFPLVAQAGYPELISRSWYHRAYLSGRETSLAL